MRNLAVLLGVSVYNNAHDLPACQNDVDNMCRLLEATGKYQILKIEEKLSKPQILEQIEQFLNADSEEKIGELLFYFSGHGHQDQSGMHFILKDTEIDRINATSLNNNEIDDMARACNPHLFVKIIDACQSGLAYIKSLDGKREIVEEKNVLDFRTEKKFENCIFMSSSKRDESSAATEECSLFTQAFIRAVLDGTKSEAIRYSDIQNYITDEFNVRKNGQTPYFNLQCDGRAIFANTTPALRQLAEEQLQNAVAVSEPESELETNVERFLAAYRSEEDVKGIIEKIKDTLNEEKLPLTWIDKYYDISIGSSNRRDFEEDEGLVKFLYEKREKENLYVEFDTDRVKNESSLGLPFFGYKTVPVRFSPLVHTLPSNITMHLSPKNDGLPKYEIDIVFVYSDTGMYIFQGARQLVRKGWNGFVQGEKKQYTYKWLEYAKFDEDNWRDYVQKRLTDCAEFVEKSLNEFVE